MEADDCWPFSCERSARHEDIDSNFVTLDNFVSGLEELEALEFGIIGDVHDEGA